MEWIMLRWTIFGFIGIMLQMNVTTNMKTSNIDVCKDNWCKVHWKVQCTTCYYTLKCERLHLFLENKYHISQHVVKKLILKNVEY